MTDNEKVVVLDDFRKQESLSPLEQHAKDAAKRWLDPALLASYDEPKSFFYWTTDGQWQLCFRRGRNR